MSWIGQWVQQKAAEYLKAGVQAGGTVAGNAVGGVGSLVEESGRSLGQGVTGSINSVGNYINGYGANIKNSLSADGPVHGTTRSHLSRPTAQLQRRGSQPESRAKNRSLTPHTNPASSPRSRTAGTSSSPVVSRPQSTSLSTKATTVPKQFSGNKKKGTPAAQPNRLPVSTRQSPCTPDGRVKISAASRPRSLSVAGGQGRALSNEHKTSKHPKGAPASHNRSVRRPDGKVLISAASRPKHDGA